MEVRCEYDKLIEELKEQSSYQDVVLKSFYAGIRVARLFSYIEFGKSKGLITKYNAGAYFSSSDWLNQGCYGDFLTYDEAMSYSNLFRPLYKEEVEHFQWFHGYGNHDYQNRIWNLRACSHHDVCFFYTPLVLGEILKANEIDPETYEDWSFCINWLADEVDEETAWTIAIPIKRTEFKVDTDFSTNHHTENPLFLKTPKSRRFPTHLFYEEKDSTTQTSIQKKLYR